LSETGAAADGATGSLRKRLSQALRYALYLARMHWPPGRLGKLRNSKAGRRIFLLGSGPSLGKLDLGLLAGEEVCVVNMGLRALDEGLPNVEIHIATDKNRYLRFADDMEAYAARHAIPLRFLGIWVKSNWLQRKDKAATPYFMVVGREPYETIGFRRSPSLGYGSCGTVLVIALQILHFLGYREVYVAGVDLDYSGEQPYFYALKDKDVVHENDSKVQHRRPLMDSANAEFEIARRAYEADGRVLANVGIGGNLIALPRLDLAVVVGAGRATGTGS
jgi:hypothetical protein